MNKWTIDDTIVAILVVLISAGILFGGDAFNDRFLQFHNMIDRDMGLDPIRPITTYIRPTAEINPRMTEGERYYFQS